MGLTRTNPNLHKAQTGSLRHEDAQGLGKGGDAKVVSDALGVVGYLGRGVTDTSITYLALFNTNGAKVYIYPNAAGNGVTVSTTQP